MLPEMGGDYAIVEGLVAPRPLSAQVQLQTFEFFRRPRPVAPLCFAALRYQN
jgi:hypothetical protein